MTNHEDHLEVYHCWLYRREAPGLRNLFKCRGGTQGGPNWSLRARVGGLRR